MKIFKFGIAKSTTNDKPKLGTNFSVTKSTNKLRAGSKRIPKPLTGLIEGRIFYSMGDTWIKLSNNNEFNLFPLDELSKDLSKLKVVYIDAAHTDNNKNIRLTVDKPIVYRQKGYHAYKHNQLVSGYVVHNNVYNRFHVVKKLKEDES